MHEVTGNWRNSGGVDNVYRKELASSSSPPSYIICPNTEGQYGASTLPNCVLRWTFYFHRRHHIRTGSSNGEMHLSLLSVRSIR